jgi:hypothetical protein
VQGDQSDGADNADRDHADGGQDGAGLPAMVGRASGFPVGNAIATGHSLLLGFGLEGVATAAERTALMGWALDHLLRPA